MDKIIQLFSLQKIKIALIVLALLGFILVFLPTSRYGAGLSPDSVGYVATARNLITGAGFTSYDGNPLIEQPPLFSIILALAGGLFKTDPLIIANIVNALVYGLIVYFGGLLTFTYLSSFPVFALIGSLAILASTQLFTVSVMAWSEPLFILFVILSLLLANSYLKKKDISSLILLSLSVTLTTLTRYIGVTLIVWGALIIIVFYHDRFKNKITHLSLFMLITVIPIGIWLIRNYTISNTLFGPRGSSAFTLSHNLKLVLNNVMAWYIPSVIAEHRPILLLFGVVIGFIAGLNWQSVKGRLQQGIPIALFVVIFIVFLVITSTTTAFDGIDGRLLSPIYFPLTLLLLIFAQAFVEQSRWRFSNKIVNLFLIIVPVIWLLAYPIRNNFIKAVDLAPDGQGYGTKAWLESETIHYLIQHQTLESECTIYTNDPEAAYILANLTTKRSPAKTFYNSKEIINDVSNLNNFWNFGNNKICLVWFDKNIRSFLFTINGLQISANIDLIVRFDDGALYSVTRK